MPRIRRGPRFTARLVNTAAEGEQPRVLDDLRTAILDGDQPPGTAIPIDAVAHFFGVSQIPVREALMTLIGEGLVDHRPHVGYSVAKLTFDEFCQLYDVRAALEAAALEAAVRYATPDDDTNVRDAHQAMTMALADEDSRAFQAESRRFHLSMLEPARLPRVLRMYEMAWNLTEPAQPMSHVALHSRADLHAEHAAMVEAFIVRDAPQLLARSAEHYHHLRTALEPMRGDPDLFLIPIGEERVAPIGEA